MKRIKTRKPGLTINRLFRTRRQWTKGAWSLDKNGYSTGARQKDAVCWCLDGAIEKCYSNRDCLRVVNRIDDYLRKQLGARYYGIPIWNDKRGRTFAHVKALVRRLHI